MQGHMMCASEDEGLTWIVQLIKKNSSPCGLRICLIWAPAAGCSCLRAGHSSHIHQAIWIDP